MSSLWNNKNKRNYILMRTIVTDIVSEGLRTIFRQEWNSRYKTTVGEWDDTPISGQELYNREKTRPHAKEYLPKFKHGNTNEWDCTVLSDVILYSNSIGKLGPLNPSIRKEVDNLRDLRNNILHVSRGQLPDRAFENASNKVRNSFKVLRLPITEIEKIISEQKRKVFSFNCLLFWAIPVVFLFLSLVFIWFPSPNPKHVVFKVLPPRPIHEVANRTANVTAILNDLRELYKINNGKLTYFYISGNPGSGKSQLSRLGGKLYDGYANLSGLTFVMTLNAETLQALLESYEDFALRLNCTERIVANIINSTQSVEIKIRHLRTQIATRVMTYHSWLLIVDNVENLKLVSPLLPQLGDEEWNGGQVLITTQDSLSIPSNSSLTAHITVSLGMGVTESCHLLATLSGGGDAEDPMLAEVAKQLDHQPLAMAAAAVYLKQVRDTKVSPEFSWHKYLEKLDEGKRQLTEEQLREINPAYLLTMTTAVLLAVRKAAETDVVLNHTFNFLSLASHDPLPLEVPINYVLLVDKNQDREQIGVKILKCSLILSEDRKGIFIRLHRIVHNVIKVYAGICGSVKEIASRFEITARTLHQYKCNISERALVPHLKAYYAMTSMFEKKKNLKNTYSTIASSSIHKIFSDFSAVLYRHGEFLLSKHFLTMALQILNNNGKKLGVHYKDNNLNEISKIYGDLGTVYEELGNLQQAKSYKERSLDTFIEQHGHDHIDVARAYNNLGAVHLKMDNGRKAMKFFKLSLGILNKLSGPNHADVAVTYTNLGNVHESLDDLEKAKEHYERAYNILKKMSRDTNLDANFATVTSNLGMLYKRFGYPQVTKKILYSTLEFQKKLFGCSHVAVATTYANLGLAHLSLGDMQQAKQYYEHALDIFIKQFGSNHVHVASCFHHLGIVHSDLGDLEKAKQFYETAIDITIKQLGPKHVNLAKSYRNLMIVHEELGNPEKAKEYEKHVNAIISMKQLDKKCML